jgi:thymidylate synthase
MIADLFIYGVKQFPRDMVTIEIVNYSSVIDMTKCIVTLNARNLNHKFRNAEAAWILDGQRDVRTICKYCENMRQFSDDGVIFAGAYGPRFIQQRRYAIRMLQNDPYTRQAVVDIWRDHPSPSKDIPCTLSWQFLIRDGKLNMISTMRSSDAWLGWPYDVFNQCMTAAWIALETNKDLKLGTLYLNCGSQHLYEKDFEKANGIRDNPNHRFIKSFDVTEYKSGQHLIDTLWERADGKVSIFDI